MNLVSKKSFMEFECKVKGHYASEEEVKELKRDPKFSTETTCERCGADIKIQRDPDDENYYIVTEL